MLQTTFRYFGFDILMSMVAFVAVFTYMGIEPLLTVLLLAVLEISLSFDNAIVNAKILKGLNKFWQRMFLYFGIFVAVIGMRLVFPVLIVSSVSDSLSFMDVFHLAIDNPVLYGEELMKVESLILLFGGGFLLMIFMDFLFDEDKADKWLKILEDNVVLDSMHKLDKKELIIVGLLAITIHYVYGNAEMFAFLAGAVLQVFISELDGLFDTGGIGEKAGIAGAISFMYLELIDASFSFDGVVGAFAVSTSIIEIMIGLGIGALFVRLLTIYFVEKGTLSVYRYLEHSAMWAIGALAMIMLIKPMFHIPELVTGLIGIAFIGGAFIHSLMVPREIESIDED